MSNHVDEANQRILEMLEQKSLRRQGRLGETSLVQQILRRNSSNLPKLPKLPKVKEIR